MDYIPVIASVEDLDAAIERAQKEPGLRYFVDKAITRWGHDPVEWSDSGLTASAELDSLPLVFSSSDPGPGEGQLALADIVDQLDKYQNGDIDAMTAAAALVAAEPDHILSVADARRNFGWFTEPEYVDLIEALTAASVRYVRTPEGARRFGQPIGSVIVRDVYLPRGQTMFGRLVKGDIFEKNGKHYQATENAKQSGSQSFATIQAFDREDPDRVNLISSKRNDTVTTKVVANRAGQKAKLQVMTDGTARPEPIEVKNSEIRVGDRVIQGAQGEDFDVTSIEKLASGEIMARGRDQYGRATETGGFDNDPKRTVVRKDYKSMTDAELVDTIFKVNEVPFAVTDEAKARGIDLDEARQGRLQKAKPDDFDARRAARKADTSMRSNQGTLKDKVDARFRSRTTGSAGDLVHRLDDDELAKILDDPSFLSYNRDPNGNHTYGEGSVERAAAAEIEWRRENNAGKVDKEWKAGTKLQKPRENAAELAQARATIHRVENTRPGFFEPVGDREKRADAARKRLSELEGKKSVSPAVTKTADDIVVGNPSDVKDDLQKRVEAARARAAATRIPGNIVGINKTNADIKPTVPEASVKPIQVVSSPDFLKKRRRDLRAEIKRDKAEGYSTKSAESNLESIEDQMREQGLLPAKKIEKQTATTVSQIKRGDTIDDTIVNWATGKDKRFKVKRVGNKMGYTGIDYYDPANPDKVYSWSGGGTQQVNKYEMVDAPAPRPASAPATLPMTDGVSTEPPRTPGARTGPFQFTNSKSLGTVDMSAKGNNPERFKPKVTLADGATPAVGTAVIDAKGRKGKIVQTYQLFSGVQWDDGKKQTLANEKLNVQNDGPPERSSTPSAPSTAPLTGLTSQTPVPAKNISSVSSSLKSTATQAQEISVGGEVIGYVQTAKAGYYEMNGRIRTGRWIPEKSGYIALDTNGRPIKDGFGSRGNHVSATKTEALDRLRKFNDKARDAGTAAPAAPAAPPAPAPATPAARMATPSAREVADAGGDDAAIRAALRREHPDWSTQQVATVAARMKK